MDSLRIGDAERHEAVELLNEQYAVGRLTSEELDERSDAVWSAKTQGDLYPVFVDLPVGPHRGGAPGPRAARPGWVPPPPVPAARTGWHGVGRYVGPLVALLVVLTVLTHLPFVLFAVILWFVLGRSSRHRRQWQRYQGQHGPWPGSQHRSGSEQERRW